jgi:hypothetical protein
VHSLHAHQSDWPTLVQNHALALLRSGEADKFPALLKRVLDDIRNDAPAMLGVSAGRASNGDEPSSSSSGKKGAQAAQGEPGLGMPKAVVDDALRVTRECLEQVVAPKD